MDQTIPSLAELLAHFRPCFRQEAFVNFSAVVEAWLIVQRQRPWYTAVASTFTAMLGKLRLAIWGGRISQGRGTGASGHEPLENLLHCLAAVR